MWQAVSPVHFVYSDRDLTLKFSLMQFNEDTLPFFMGGGGVDAVTGSTGVYQYDIADRPFAMSAPPGWSSRMCGRATARP